MKKLSRITEPVTLMTTCMMVLVAGQTWGVWTGVYVFLAIAYGVIHNPPGVLEGDDDV